MKFYVTKWPDQLVYGYDDERQCWCFYAAETQKPVGYPYCSKEELVEDMDRYAQELWGLS